MACSAGDLQNSVSFRLDADNVNSAGTDRQTPGAAENEGDDDDKESLSFDASAAVAFACEESHPHPTYCYQTQRIFEMFCLDTLRVSMRSHVESVVCFKPEPTGSESSMSFMSMSSPAKGEEPEEELETHAQEVLGIVQRLREFIEGAGNSMPACFPPEWPLLEWVFAPCEATLVGIAYAAATDAGKDWSFKAYMELEKAVRACLATAQSVGVNLDSIQTVESSMQVCDLCCSRHLLGTNSGSIQTAESSMQVCDALLPANTF
jgi:hypothetical protein